MTWSVSGALSALHLSSGLNWFDLTAGRERAERELINSFQRNNRDVSRTVFSYAKGSTEKITRDSRNTHKIKKPVLYGMVDIPYVH